MQTLKLAVLVSGSGTNLQAIIDAIQTKRLNAELTLVVSNKPGVRALERAEQAGIATCVVNHKQFDSREAFERTVVAAIRESGASWVVLAGFMRILTDELISAFEQRILNIHPSLLPAFPGVRAQQQAFDYGVKVSGCTVHLVDHGVDTGPIIAQRAVCVLPGDDAERLPLGLLPHRVSHVHQFCRAGMVKQMYPFFLSQEFKVQGFLQEVSGIHRGVNSRKNK